MSDFHFNRREMLLAAGAGAMLNAGAKAATPPRSRRKSAQTAMFGFASAQIAAAASESGRPAPRVRYLLDARMSEQSFRFDGIAAGNVTVFAGDENGAMYGGLDIAEALRVGPEAMAQLADGRVRTPNVRKRGIKFNIPLDLRTPSYSDGSTSARLNIPEVWTLPFWETYFDEMAKWRYNVLSLWNLHPFPSMVRVPEYPDVALDDVWRSLEPLGPAVFNPRGSDAVPPRYLANHEVVKKITIEEKVKFWRRVMEMAAGRGIEVYIFTWNIFIYGVEGKYGIDDSITNPKTIAYMRASVRQLVKTYPLLAGIGVTAGENLPTDNPQMGQEQWLWETYGEGVRDALKADPSRRVNMIHRFHETSGDEIERHWQNYPGYPATFTTSYKYSVAHMYSSTNPPFIAETGDSITPENKTWLTVRSDDFYSFRWGDPDFARDYVANMPARDRLVGFYMGPDGYCWGRDFLERKTAGKDLGVNRKLVMQTQWYTFALWGRLSFDPTLPNTHFAGLLGSRFPGADKDALYAAACAASKIIPQTTRCFWKDVDHQWLPEACSHLDRRGKLIPLFYTIADFMESAGMPGTDILSVRRWRYRLAHGLPLRGPSPLDCADNLEGYAATALKLIAGLRAASDPNDELVETLNDFEAVAHLGDYFGSKFRAACALALFDESRRKSEQDKALRHLANALEAWKRYAAVRDGQYLPGFYNRIGYVDITALTAKVADDIAIARSWQPGSLKFDPSAPETYWDKTLAKATTFNR